MNPVTLKSQEMKNRLKKLEQMLENSRAKHVKEAWNEIEQEIEAMKEWLHQLKDPAVKIPNKEQLLKKAEANLNILENDPYGPTGEIAHLHFQEQAKQLLSNWR
ncbi:MAG: hypothetical protein AB7F31_02875 [Parachlamydiales bacterium]